METDFDCGSRALCLALQSAPRIRRPRTSRRLLDPRDPAMSPAWPRRRSQGRDGRPRHCGGPHPRASSRPPPRTGYRLRHRAAITGMLCGILVDEENRRVVQTLGETFPDLKKSMHPQYQAVTLEQLLTHRGGAPGQLEKRETSGASLWTLQGNPHQRPRRALLVGVTSKPPRRLPERNTSTPTPGRRWPVIWPRRSRAEQGGPRPREDLRPLGMNTAGFDTEDAGQNDRPRGRQRTRLPSNPVREQTTTSPSVTPGCPLLGRRLGQVRRRQPARRQGQARQTQKRRSKKLRRSGRGPGEPKYDGLDHRRGANPGPATDLPASRCGMRRRSSLRASPSSSPAGQPQGLQRRRPRPHRGTIFKASRSRSVLGTAATGGHARAEAMRADSAHLARLIRTAAWS